MDSELNDIELIQRINNRDSKSLEALYDRYAPVLYTLVNKIVGDSQKTEEVLADIFVIIWQKSCKFDTSSNNLYGWLINLTRNKALDFKRREDLIISSEYNDEYEDNFILPSLSPSIPVNDLNSSINNREKIFSAFNGLTEAQQYVLSLAYFNGLTETEIASKLNIPVLTVKSKIRVALNSLNEIINKEVTND